MNFQLLLLGFITFSVIQNTFAEIQEIDCLTELNQLIANNSHENMSVELIKLQGQCPEIPEIFHQLGVSHANQKNWESAISFFNQALEKQSLAFASHQALIKIHRYRATLAYRQALGSNLAPPKVPRFKTAQFNSKTPIPEASTADLAIPEKTLLNPIILAWLDKKSHPAEATKIPYYLIEKAGKETLIVIIQTHSQTLHSLRLQGNPDWKITQEQSIPW